MPSAKSSQLHLQQGLQGHLPPGLQLHLPPGLQGHLPDEGVRPEFLL